MRQKGLMLQRVERGLRGLRPLRVILCLRDRVGQLPDRLETSQVLTATIEAGVLEKGLNVLLRRDFSCIVIFLGH